MFVITVHVVFIILRNSSMPCRFNSAHNFLHFDSISRFPWCVAISKSRRLNLSPRVRCFKIYDLSWRIVIAHRLVWIVFYPRFRCWWKVSFRFTFSMYSVFQPFLILNFLWDAIIKISACGGVRDILGKPLSRRIILGRWNLPCVKYFRFFLFRQMSIFGRVFLA